MAASAINLAQNDSRRVFEGLQYFHFAWSAVFEVAAVILFLLLEVGVSGLAAVAVIALLIPTQAVFVRAIGRRQRAAMTKTVRLSRTPAALCCSAVSIRCTCATALAIRCCTCDAALCRYAAQCSPDDRTVIAFPSWFPTRIDADLYVPVCLWRLYAGSTHTHDGGVA